MSKNIQNEIAKASGTQELLRNDKISTKIGEQVPFPMQMAIVFNALEDLYAKMQALHGVDFRPEEFKEYSELRKTIKALVDSEMSK